MTDLCCSPDDAAANLERLRKLQEEVSAEGVTDEELERAKNKITSQVVLQSERPSARLMAVGSGWVQRQSYRTVREVMDSYLSLSKDDVNRALETYPLSPNTTFSIGPTD